MTMNMLEMFERLEDRVLLAASVKMKGDTLIINGDGSDDAIYVSGAGLATGEVEVAHDSDGDGIVDTFLGTFDGVANIQIKSKGGDDAIGVFAVDITGDLTIVTGGGDDCVINTLSEIDGDVSVKTGGGNDLALLLNCVIGGAASLVTGGGDDIAGAAACMIGGTSTINTGGGDDLVTLTHTVSTGIVNINAGGGDDEVGLDDGNLVPPGSKVSGGGGRGDLFADGDEPGTPVFDISGFEIEATEFTPAAETEFENLVSECLLRLIPGEE
ncbi:MAG: hypothetical protein R3C01_16995 [Planctomycetaceae bacterium]